MFIYMCFDIVEIWFGIANGQISSYLPATYLYFSLQTITSANISGFSQTCYVH